METKEIYVHKCNNCQILFECNYINNKCKCNHSMIYTIVKDVYEGKNNKTYILRFCSANCNLKYKLY